MKRPGVVLMLCLLVGSSAARAQVAPPSAAGVKLPRAYYDRVAQDPRAFTLPNGFFAVTSDGAHRVRPALGAKRMIVIPALFADSPDPPVTSEQIQETLFTGPAPRGTLTDAYAEMSRGKLLVGGDVAPWVRTSLTRSEVVGASDGLGSDARIGDYLQEALALEDPNIDFGMYDNDGPDGIPNSGDDDGRVDVISFQFPDVAASCGGPGIWPHMSGISAWNNGQPYVTDDKRPDGSHIVVDAYIVESAVNCDGTGIESAAVIAHELGHVLGLPDYYNAGYYNSSNGDVGAAGRDWVLGCWDLMAAGAWGCGPVTSEHPQFGPTHMSAYPKQQLGWVDFLDVGQVHDQRYELESMETSGRALRIPLDGSGREHLLMEYRERIGFDSDLPAGGVMIYHEDAEGQLHPASGSGNPYFLSVIEQDHDRGLMRDSAQGGDRGEGGDAWGVGGVAEKLDYMTAPSLALSGGGPTPVTIHSVVAEDDRAVVWLSSAPQPVIMPPADSTPVTPGSAFQRHFLVSGGYMPYTFAGAVPTGVTVAANGDDLLLSGSVSAAGGSAAGLRVIDARGSVSPVLFYPFVAVSLELGADEVLQALLRSDATAPTQADEEYLDAAGNANGQYDVGDLRAWLRAHPSAGN